MRPPSGFEATKYPLRHELNYGFGLSCVSETQNSTIVPLIRNYKTVTAASSVEVNPHNSTFQVDAGSVCRPMSIIDKLRLNMSFVLTEDAILTDKVKALKMQWTPIFFSFPEKPDAADDLTTTTVKDILELTLDATQEDVTPLYSTVKLDVTTPSEEAYPLSTANLAETIVHANLDSSSAMESVAFDNKVFHDALQYYTNKGALKACIGTTRHVLLTQDRPYTSVHIDKFVPRAVRRIVPYSFFGILFHLPVYSDVEQAYSSLGGTSGLSDIGIKVIAKYHEWHQDMDQLM